MIKRYEFHLLTWTNSLQARTSEAANPTVMPTFKAALR
jgi:hypothetical protein